MSYLNMTRRLHLALVLAACGPGVLQPQDSGTTETSASETSTAVTATTAPDPTSSTSSTTTPATSTDSTSTAVTTSADLPDLPIDDSCYPWQPDCPPGQKCTYYNEDGGGYFNDYKCVRLAIDPIQLGEPCTVDGFTGYDDCDIGLLCLQYIDGPRCIPMCTGSVDDPDCPQDYTCDVFGDGVGLCLDSCDPLLQDCAPEKTCIGNEDDNGFLCFLDASGDGGQTHTSCMWGNDCDPGLLCVEPTAAAECDPRFDGCCEPFCDLTLPNTCPGEDQECLPYYNDPEVPPWLEHIGYCSLP